MTPSGGPLGALEASGLGQAMRRWLWLYPSVEVVHIVVSRYLSARTLARHVLPWTAARHRVHPKRRVRAEDAADHGKLPPPPSVRAAGGQLARRTLMVVA